MLQIGCLLAGVVAISAAAGTVAVWAVAGALGMVHAAPVLILAALAVLALLVGSAVVRGLRHLSRPVGAVIDAARRIEAGDYSARVPESGPSEVRSVARAFNSMSARLEATDARRRSFLADVTHELRTPLAVIRGQTEAIADGVYPPDAAHLATILDATRTLEGLLEDLRTLALSDAGSLGLGRERVDLRDLVDDTVAGFRAQAEAAGIDLAPAVADGIPPADADPARLRSVLGNLVTNSLRHTPAGGTIRIAAGQNGGALEVSVTDNGEGIPAELLPRVFDRFVKGAGSRGSGLGLAIAADVVRAHGGSIDIESEPGTGTTVRFTLPAFAL